MLVYSLVKDVLTKGGGGFVAQSPPHQTPTCAASPSWKESNLSPTEQISVVYEPLSKTILPFIVQWTKFYGIYDFEICNIFKDITSFTL